MNPTESEHTRRRLPTPIKERDVYENIVNRDFEEDPVLLADGFFRGASPGR